jgi:hypothetical protein
MIDELTLFDFLKIKEHIILPEPPRLVPSEMNGEFQFEDYRPPRGGQSFNMVVLSRMRGRIERLVIFGPDKGFPWGFKNSVRREK